MAHRPLCEINVYSQYKTLCCENTMDGKTMFNHHLLWLFLFPWEIPALINHKMKGDRTLFARIEAIFLPMIDDSWSGGNCPLAGTLMPRAFKMDFSMVIVLPLASLI